MIKKIYDNDNNRNNHNDNNTNINIEKKLRSKVIKTSVVVPVLVKLLEVVVVKI